MLDQSLWLAISFILISQPFQHGHTVFRVNKANMVFVANLINKGKFFNIVIIVATLST